MNNRIKEVRQALGLNQGELGKAMCLTNNYIYLLESGKKPVSDKFITMLCNTYHVNREWLETGEGSMFEPTARASEIEEIQHEIIDTSDLKPSAERRILDLVKILQEMSPEQVELLYNVAQGFKKDE